MTDCKLTSHGERVIERVADIVRDGGAVTTPTTSITYNGFDYLGSGDARMVFEADTNPAADPVFEGGDCVVKLSMYPDGWQNETEIVNWEFSPPEVRNLLAPVTQHADDGTWLVMPKAEGTGVNTDPWPLLNEMEEAGYVLSDVRSDHIGLVNGDPKIIDYGHRIRTLSEEPVGPSPGEYL